MTGQDAEIETLFSKISDYVVESRRLLEQGALLELKGLDDGVHLMCDALMKMSQDQRIRYAGKLQELQAEMQSLGDTIVAMRDSVGSELLATTPHKKASVAYRKGETDKKN